MFNDKKTEGSLPDKDFRGTPKYSDDEIAGFFSGLLTPKTEFNKQWGESIARFNFTQVPNALLNCQGHLGLRDGELLTYIHLASFRFRSTSQIFPAIQTLCLYSENGYSTIQKRLKQLEKKGFIKQRQRFNSSNMFDITPGINLLSKHLKNCPRPPRFFDKTLPYFDSSDPSFSINKEYELKTPTNNTETVSFRGQTFVERGEDDQA